LKAEERVDVNTLNKQHTYGKEKEEGRKEKAPLSDFLEYSRTKTPHPVRCFVFMESEGVW